MTTLQFRNGSLLLKDEEGNNIKPVWQPRKTLYCDIKYTPWTELKTKPISLKLEMLNKWRLFFAPLHFEKFCAVFRYAMEHQGVLKKPVLLIEHEENNYLGRLIRRLFDEDYNEFGWLPYSNASCIQCGKDKNFQVFVKAKTYNKNWFKKPYKVYSVSRMQNKVSEDEFDIIESTKEQNDTGQEMLDMFEIFLSYLLSS